MVLKTAKLTRQWKICRIIHQKFCIYKFFCNFALNINNPQSNNQIFLFSDVRVKITLILIID